MYSGPGVVPVIVRCGQNLMSNVNRYDQKFWFFHGCIVNEEEGDPVQTGVNMNHSGAYCQHVCFILFFIDKCMVGSTST